jgi:predicted phosphodiesterase
MRLQLLSDLHLETEDFTPTPAPGADVLVLAGDIDATWQGLARFAGWPVPVLFVAGNHEFDGRDLAAARPDLREHCARLGIALLERESRVLEDSDGRRVRFVATTRWSDFDLFGARERSRAMRAAGYFVRLMGATWGDTPFDAEAIRAVGLADREWLGRELARDDHGCDATVALTHFAPSLRSADPRYGALASTASFCNADDDLLVHADLWIHGHLHCRHDYRVVHSGGTAMRVVSNARGHAPRRESDGYDALRTVEV